MDKKSVLYCGTQSTTRHNLLRLAEIPFKVVELSVCEEDALVRGTTAAERAMEIAQYKHIGLDVPALILAHEESKEPIFLLTADTVIQGVVDGYFFAKPESLEQARELIQKISSQEIIVATGMSLSVWQYHPEEEGWYNSFHETWVSEIHAQFNVPSDEVEYYFARHPIALRACGAAAGEDFGMRYFKSLNGSYSGALGLDIYSLYHRLKKLGFRC